MLKAQKTSTRWWVLMPLTGICFGMTLIVSGAVLLPTLPPILPCPGVNSTSSGGFPLPPVRQSLNGLLYTTLHACISRTPQKMLDQNAVPPQTVEFFPPTFEGTFPGPTLLVKPRDKLSILLVNDLPANPPERGSAFPHHENSINLHTHGLTVSPLGASDNIFREMKPAHDKPSKHPDPRGSSVWHLLVPCAQAWIGDVSIPRRYGWFLDRQGRTGNPRHSARGCCRQRCPHGLSARSKPHDGSVVFVHEQAQQFGTFPFPDFTKNPPVLPSSAAQGVWSTYGLDGQLPLEPDGKTPAPPSRFSYTTNGVANPTLQMRPGEVQRWRLLNAIDGDNLQLVLVSNVNGQNGLGLNVVAMDAITAPKTYHLAAGDPLVIGPGQRMDVMVKAGTPGTYLLQTLDPNSGEVKASVSPYRDQTFPAGSLRLGNHLGTVLIFPAHVPVWVTHLVRVGQHNSSIRLRSQPSRSPVRPKT